jgi:hypothetical protein
MARVTPCVRVLLLLATAALVSAGAVADEILERWLRAWQGGLAVDARTATAYKSHLERATLAARDDVAARARLRFALLETLALVSTAAQPATEFSAAIALGASEDEVQRKVLARAAGEALRADSGAFEWLSVEVLPSVATHSLARRRAALVWLLERPQPTLATALLVIGRRADDPLRPDALRALSRWAATEGANDAIDLFLVSLLGRGERADTRPHPFGLLQERLLTCPKPLGAEAALLLRERAVLMLQATDWKQTARAIQLLRGMELEVRVPLLLDALSLWSRRAETGAAGETRGSKRIEGDIIAELQRISGKSIGTNPRNWIAWWVAVRQGRVELADASTATAAPEGDDGLRSRASFFGLRATTDRVTFIIDHSGSMAVNHGTRDHTRYAEAIEQMTRFLQATGPEARFNVVLFDTSPLRSSTELIPASAENLERARVSLLGRPPDGGTHLVPALELALCLGPDGQVDHEQFMADTIIILCDGEIHEGSAWVAPLMQRVLPETLVRIHCVLIGNHGGEALQELARLSGGDFMRVQG